MNPSRETREAPGQNLVVCIPTCRRQQLLRECLASIKRLQVPAGATISVLVVDNDEAGSARDAVEEVSVAYPFSIHYFIEAQRGLASVRNRLVKEAVALGADYLAFIDDDEQASEEWLSRHIDMLDSHQADVSCGPVRPVGASLVVQGKKPHPTGSVPRHVSTNNVVISSKLVSSQGLVFDTFYNFIGGEDFDFFERSRDLGNRHVWCEEAFVEETITAERDNFSYLFYRHYSGGINAVKRFRKKRTAIGAWLRFMPKAMGKLLGALVYFLLSLLGLRKIPLAIATKKLASGVGYIAGLLNVSTARYASDPAEQAKA